MASSLVLILLLDNIPGNINKTLNNITPFGQHLANSNACMSNNIVDPILKVVTRKLDIKIIPKWRQNLEKQLNLYFVNKTRDIFEETSIETLFNIQAVLDNSADVENSNSFERSKTFFETRVKGFSSEDKSQCDDANKIEDQNDVIYDKHFINYNASSIHMIVNKTHSMQESKNTTDLPEEFKNRRMNEIKQIKEFPKSVPFLVAIFESYLNVTAQTCGGAVVSPHWVLTAASCVNVLGNLFNVSGTDKSQYTIIANSTNPLLEGSIHRVTQVILHPDSNATTPYSVFGLIKHLHNRLEDSKRNPNTKERQSKVPQLALMKVDPEIQVEPVEISEENVGNNTEVWLYGWQMNNNETGNITMVSSSFPARTMSPFDCEIQYGIIDRSTMCLATNDALNTQLSAGSPVVSMRGRRLSLLGLHSQHSPLFASSVLTHAPWISRIINNVLI